MDKKEQMIAAPKKVMDSLAEVFMGFAHMCEGVSEQMEELLKLAEDVSEEDEKVTPIPVKQEEAPKSRQASTTRTPRRTIAKKEKPVVEAVPEIKEEPEQVEPEKQEDTSAEEETATEQESTTEETPPWESPGDSPAKPAIAEADITKVIVAKIKQDRKNNDKIGQLLATYKVAKLSELPAEKYEDFLMDLSQI